MGWQGDRREVRWGFTAGAIRYALGIIPALLAILRNEKRYALWERALGHTSEHVMDTASQIRHFILDLLAEAGELMDDL